MTRHLFSLAVLALAGLARADPPLDVFPPKIQLHGPRAEQRVGVLGQRELTRSASYRIADARIASVGKEGIVRPTADGTTTLAIEADGRSASIPVIVKGATAETPVSYSRE